MTTNYDLNGTVFYNLALKRLGAIPPWSALAAAWLRLVAVPEKAETHIAKQWGDALKHGRLLARHDAVQACVIKPGRIAARVATGMGAKGELRNIKVNIAIMPDSVWTQCAIQISQQAQLAAEIARGTLPEALLNELMPSFNDVGVEIDGIAQSVTHPPDPLVVALWYAVAERIDADPWLWVLLRGQVQTNLLDLARQYAREEAQHQAAQSRASVLPLNRFWTVPALASTQAQPQDTTQKAQSRIIKQMQEFPSPLRVGRRRLSKILARAMSQ